MDAIDEYVIVVIADGYSDQAYLDVLTKEQAICKALELVQEQYDINMCRWQGRKAMSDAVCLDTAKKIETNELELRRKRVYSLRAVDLDCNATLMILPLRRPLQQQKENKNE